jgi:hypothetical protein
VHQIQTAGNRRRLAERTRLIQAPSGEVWLAPPAWNRTLEIIIGKLPVFDFLSLPSKMYAVASNRHGLASIRHRAVDAFSNAGLNKRLCIAAVPQQGKRIPRARSCEAQVRFAAA